MTSLTANSTPDMRWVTLDLVCSVRSVLGLRDHDIATLRGLLSLIGPEGWQGPMMVHASNKVLAARCDGADERSLRRRLTKLVDAGLILRRQSPNRKRYVLRDAEGQPLVYYGFDLTPLRDALPQLEEMAKAHMAELDARRTARGLLRHRLYEITVLGTPTTADDDTLEEARLALRRQVDSMTLESLLAALGEADLTNEMTDGDSQIDRHIENPNQDSSFELNAESSENCDMPKLSLNICLMQVTETAALFPKKPAHWSELHQYALEIGACLGLSSVQIRQAYTKLGRYGASLAFLGLCEAQSRIKNMGGYLCRILADADRPDFDFIRMFNALTRKKFAFPAGNSTAVILG